MGQSQGQPQEHGTQSYFIVVSMACPDILGELICSARPVMIAIDDCVDSPYQGRTLVASWPGGKI